MAGILRVAFDMAEGLFGVHIFRSKSAPHWPEAQFEREFLAYLDVDCVLDVGANIGQYASSLRAIAKFRGTILSFEPNPVAFAKLSAACSADPDWHCFPYALGDKSSSSLLNVAQSDVFSSLLEPGGGSQQHFAEQTRTVQKAEVEVVALDDIFDEFKTRFAFSRAFLKMDTQGFDLRVTAGARRALKCIVGIMSEVSVVPLYEQQPSFQECIDAFNQDGFEPIGLFNVHAGSGFAPLLECNCYLMPVKARVPHR